MEMMIAVVVVKVVGVVVIGVVSLCCGGSLDGCSCGVGVVQVVFDVVWW